ncbi:Protein of unknown function [Bacillus mycoides]|nr:Protein of unknown function [Bacillus mycoides]
MIGSLVAVIIAFNSYQKSLASQ